MSYAALVAEAPSLAAPASTAPSPGHAAGLTAARSQYLTVPNNAGLPYKAATSFSVTGWFYLNALPAGYMRVVTKLGTAGGDQWFLQINPTGGPGSTPTWEWGIFDGTAYHLLDWSATAIAASWQFLFAAWVDSTEQLFMSVNNGTLVSTSNLATVPHASTSPVVLGSDGNLSAGLFFDGAMDAVALWNVNLSPSDVSTIYNSGAGIRYSAVPQSGDFLTVAAWWELDGALAGVWPDASGNGNTLAAPNGAQQVAGKT